jgi:hypothetical protein
MAPRHQFWDTPMPAQLFTHESQALPIYLETLSRLFARTTLSAEAKGSIVSELADGRVNGDGNGEAGHS